MARSDAGAGPDLRPLPDPGTGARDLFGYAAAWSPPAAAVAAGWGAWDGPTLVGAALLERAGEAGMLHGPVVVLPAPAEPERALDVAHGLVKRSLETAPAIGLTTVFARPQGLDRIWVREGFIPVPESELPQPLRGTPGAGLYGWRGGSALWSAADRGRPRRPREG